MRFSTTSLSLVDSAKGCKDVYSNSHECVTLSTHTILRKNRYFKVWYKRTSTALRFKKTTRLLIILPSNKPFTLPPHRSNVSLDPASGITTINYGKGSCSTAQHIAHRVRGRHILLNLLRKWQSSRTALVPQDLSVVGSPSHPPV